MTKIFQSTNITGPCQCSIVKLALSTRRVNGALETACTDSIQSHAYNIIYTWSDRKFLELQTHHACTVYLTVFTSFCQEWDALVNWSSTWILREHWKVCSCNWLIDWLTDWLMTDCLIGGLINRILFTFKTACPSSCPQMEWFWALVMKMASFTPSTSSKPSAQDRVSK